MDIAGGVHRIAQIVWARRFKKGSRGEKRHGFGLAGWKDGFGF